jgi:hypothetical protein
MCGVSGALNYFGIGTGPGAGYGGLVSPGLSLPELADGFCALSPVWVLSAIEVPRTEVMLPILFGMRFNSWFEGRL